MIVSPDKHCRLDGSVLRISELINSPIHIIPLTRIDGFVFNEALYSLDKYILLDYTELHWDSHYADTHLFGRNTDMVEHIFQGEEWAKFDEFVAKKPAEIYFKREVNYKDVKDNVLPIDYPCYVEPIPIQTKEQYLSRPINVFNFWGRSSEYRVKFHADVWANSSRNGAAICDNMYYLERFLAEESSTNKWVSLNIPHYARVNIGQILGINGLSKLSMSMWGSGKKCFRDSEAPVNSLMVMQNSNIRHTFEWVHGVNCLKVNSGEVEISRIDELLQRDDLYEIYVNGVENLDKYRAKNYIQYIENTIKERIG